MDTVWNDTQKGIPTRIAAQGAWLPQGYNDTIDPPTLYTYANNLLLNNWKHVKHIS